MTEEQKSILIQNQEITKRNLLCGEKKRQICNQQRIQYRLSGAKKAKENDVLHIMGCMLYWVEGSKNKIVTMNLILLYHSRVAKLGRLHPYKMGMCEFKPRPDYILSS